MDYSITIPEQSVTFINLSGIIMISAIIIIGFILLMRYAAKFVPGLMGILCYLLIVVVGVELVTYIIAAIPLLGTALLGNVVLFCITRAVITAGLCHGTRIVILKFTDRNQDMQLGDALMGGLGIAVGGAVVVGTSFIYLSTLAATINAYGLEALLADIPLEEQTELVGYIANIASIAPATFLMQGLGYTIDLIFQVAVLLLLYAVVKKGLPVFWHGVIVLCNIVLETLSNFANYSVWENYPMMVCVKLVILVGIIAAALRVDSDYLGGELRSFAKLKRKKDAMPKFDNIKKK
ncbi:MAG: YhfC family glutamic-type intramembrane protease [Alistipes sp.]|nr:YhfC family glutamic-type intramembrane protease [Alistipes sp.]